MVARWQDGARRGVALVSVGLLVACGGGGGGAGGGGPMPEPPVVAQPGADYFPLAVGDRWFYADGTPQASAVRVTGTQALAGGTAMVVRTQDADGGSDELYLRDASGVRLVPGADADALTAALGPLQMLKLPLVGGDRWVLADKTLPNVEDLDRDGKPDTIALRIEATVVGFETLAVGGQSLARVAHVQTTLTQRATLTGTGQTVTQTITSDDWYAPDLGLVRNRVSGDPAGASESTLSAWRVGTQRSETVAPTLARRAPEADATVGGCCVAVTLTFSEAMDTTVDGARVWQLAGPDGRPVAGRLSWSADARTASFAPAAPLASGRYSATLGTGAQDRLGNPLGAETRWQFSVDASGPAVTPVRPLADAPEVPLDSTVVFTLDEDVDAATVNASTVALVNETRSSFVEAQVGLSGRTVTLTPAAPLRSGDRYRVNVFGVVDRFGNASSASWNFRADPGRFAAPVSLLPDNVPVSAVATGVLFGDGHTSVVMATGYNAGATGDFKLLVHRIAADGSASAPQRYDTLAGYGAEVTGLVVAPLAQGGEPAVIASAWGIGIQVFRPQPDGTLAVTQTLSTAASYIVWLADLDGDGRLDLIGRPFSGTTTSIWMQQADGSFGAAQTLALEANGFGNLAVGDLNGDGRPDIVSVGGGLPGREIGMAYQQVDGRFAVQAVGLPAGGSVRGVAIGDVNGDGRNDLVIAYPGGSLAVRLQNAQGELGPFTSMRSGPSTSTVVLGDIDGDGRLDVVASGWGGWPATLHRQRSDGSLGGPELFPVYGYGQDSPNLLALGDVNGDGLTDIVYAGSWLRQRAVPATEPPAPAQSATGRAARLGLAGRAALRR